MKSRTLHQVVRASAGTGKTYRLAAHYLSLLHRGASPQTIVATTFTRKAAGEILERVLSRLSAAAMGVPEQLAKLSNDLGTTLDAPQCRQMLANLARNLHRVAIGTIDSFFNRAVAVFSLELGVPPGVSVVAENDPLAQQLRWQAIEAVLADEDLPDLLTLVRWLLKDTAGHDVAKELDQAIGNFYEVFQETPGFEAWSALEPPGDALSPAELAAALDCLSICIQSNTCDKLAAPLQSNYEAAATRDWMAFLSKGLAKKISEGGKGPFTFGSGKTLIPDDIVAALKPLIEHAKAFLVAQVAQRTRGAWELLSRFDAHYRRLRRQHHLLLFSDLTHLLARAAPEIDDLYYRLDARVQHLLLDEFQDTSRSQWRVLRPLAQEITAHANGERSFFCVGDPKQAIYAWRGGCAGLFDELQRDLRLPPEAFSQLDTSHRSSPVVLDAVNRVFRGLIANPAVADYPRLAQAWASGFPEQKAEHADLPGHVVLKTLCAEQEDEDGANGDDGEAAEPGGFLEKTANYVRDLVCAHPRRPVGVLLRWNKNLSRLIYLLRQRGLSVSGEGGNPLGDDSAVNLVLSALRLADYPGDEPSVFHLLHSPLAPIIGLSSDQSAHVDAVALALRRRLIDDGYAAVISEWAHRLAPVLDRRNTARLTQLVSLADAYDAQPSLRPDLFARYVRETRVEEPTPAAVRIMTIHAAKGLEFDAVVLPELDGLLSRGRFSHFVQRGEHGEPQAVFAAASEEVCQLSQQLKDGHAAAKSQQVQDELCALYVAMTRAKYALHMLIKPLGKQNDGGVNRHRCCPSNILRHALGPDDERELQERVLFESGDRNWHVHPAVCHETLTQPPQPVRLKLQPASTTAPVSRFWRRVAPSSLEDGGRVNVERLVGAQENSALRRGALMHRWMSLVEWIDCGPLPTDAQLLASARESGWTDSAAVSDTLTAFKSILEVPSVGLRAALARPTGEVELWRERPFVVRLGDEMFSGAFDRVVLHKRDGRVHRAELWDFKTDRVDAENLQAVAERYRPQLAAYRKALAGMLDLPLAAITAKLLFLITGRVCDLFPS